MTYKILLILISSFVFNLLGYTQDSLANHFKTDSSPQTLQLSNIEIQDQFIDFKKLNDPTYLQSIEFGKALSRSFDSVAAYYNYPLTLNLPYYLNDLTFNFSAIDWKAPHKIEYSYFLEGLDQEWSEKQRESKVSFQNLSYGHYTLKLRAIGESQIWSEPFIYSFDIRRPWWRTVWAYLIYALSILAIIIAAFRWWDERKKQVEEMQQLLAAHNALAFSTSPQRRPPPKSDGFLNLVHQTLETHLSDENFGIAELCEILNISRAHLHRKLKKMTGRSTSHYIRALRLDIAKDMLEQSELNVSEVAFSVGFSSATYFSKAFKAEFGYTPKELK